ncbi:MAG: substrate-binding domain-containing protein [Candidatus Thorarchaeota archaeon]
MIKARVRRVKKHSKLLILIIFISGFFGGYFSTNLIFWLNKEEVTHIYIIYSSEKASWMTQAYTDFMEEWEKKHPDEKIMIHMHPYGSADSIISILNGEIFPTIWSPASSIWMPYLNTKWKEYTGSKKDIVDIFEAVKIIYSPIVIATWEKFNKTNKIKGFNDVFDLIADIDVEIKMGHTDPRLSNSGFMTVIMAISAATGKSSEDITMKDLQDDNNQKWLTVFESIAVMYGKSTGFLSRYMQNQGPDGLNLAFLYENLIVDISSESTEGKIIAIYPEEGTLYSDHPFCILNADWVTPKQERIAGKFLKFLNENKTIKSALEYGFRPIDTSIPLDKDIFNYKDNGIAYTLNVTELSVPKDEEALLRIPDMWLLCKNRGL